MLTDRHWQYFRSLLPGCMAYAVDQAGMQRLFTTPNLMFSEQAGGRWVMREPGQEKAIGLIQFGGRFEASSTLQLHPDAQPQPVPAPVPDVGSLPPQSPAPTLPEEAGPDAVYGNRPSDVLWNPQPEVPEFVGVPPGHPAHNGQTGVVQDAAGMWTTAADTRHIETEQMAPPPDLLSEVAELLLEVVRRMPQEAKNSLQPLVTRVAGLQASYQQRRAE